MTFKEWYFNEVGFGTNCIAHFSMPLGGFVRNWPSSIEDSEWKPNKEKHEKKKEKKKS